MIQKISNETIAAILRKSAYRLPDNPSEQGMKAPDIKKAFYEFINDASASICAEVNRIVQEANDDISSKDTTVDSHTDNKNNPHEVTKTQVGLGNADNTSDMDKPVSTAQQEAIGAVQTNLTTHENNVENPHAVTKAQVGLGEVDNTSDADKPISTAQQKEFDNKIDKTSIIDDLTSEDETKVLSAKQGRLLNEKIPTTYGYTIECAYVAATGVLSVLLKDKNANVLSTASVDLPLELLLSSSGSYYDNGVLYLKLANGSFISVDVSDLVSTQTADGQTISLSPEGVISISQTYKAKIDEAYEAKHTHTNRDLLETYTQTEANIADAVGKKHSHSNKSILDSTTASFTTEQKNNLTTLMAGALPQEEQITVSASDWNGGTSCTKSSTKAKANNIIFASALPSDISKYTNANIRVVGQTAGQITLQCDTTPTENITIVLVVWG